LSKITKGRWGYRPHPQPDIGKEATAAVNLHQNGMLDPMMHWVDNAQDPEDVAEARVRWAVIKKEAAERKGFTVQEVFGAGPAMPLSQTESTTENTTVEEPTELSRHEFAISDRELDRLIVDAEDKVELYQSWIVDFREMLSGGELDQDETQKVRVELDQTIKALAEYKGKLAKLKARKDRRGKKKPEESKPDKKARVAKTAKAKERNERHALTVALISEGKSEKEALAIAYDIIEKGQFSWGKLPSDIQESYKP